MNKLSLKPFSRHLQIQSQRPSVLVERGTILSTLEAVDETHDRKREKMQVKQARRDSMVYEDMCERRVEEWAMQMVTQFLAL